MFKQSLTHAFVPVDEPFAWLQMNAWNSHKQKNTSKREEEEEEEEEKQGPAASSLWW